MPTLGLAMIVKDEEEVLARCLESFQGIFDEIVIVDTGSQDQTKEIASSFGAKIHDFKWIEDFSAARNFAFAQASCDYTMWIDADDVLLPENRLKLLHLKSELGDADYYMLPYDYAQDEFGNSTCLLSRERIIRKNPDPLWQYPIHECMIVPPNWKKKNVDIVITHRRTAKSSERSKGRNLRILQQAVDKNPNQRMRYYLAKELYDSGKSDEAIPAFEKYLSQPDWNEQQVLATYYLALSYYRTGNAKATENTCLQGILRDPRRAEFFNLIASIRCDRGDWTSAIPWYDISTKLGIPPTTLQIATEEYTWLPHHRLTKCYSDLGMFREAAKHNDEAMKYRPTDPHILFNRLFVRDRLYGRLEERPIRLNLNSGGKKEPSYRTCDPNPVPGVDHVIDQSSLPFHDGTLHAIRNDYGLGRSKDSMTAKATVEEWARTLKYGGRLDIKVIDVEECAKKLIEAEDQVPTEDNPGPRETWKNILFSGLDGSLPNLTGFTRREIRFILESAGFEIDRFETILEGSIPTIEISAFQRKRPPKIRWLIRWVDEMPRPVREKRIAPHQWLVSNGVDSALVQTYLKGSNDVGALVSELRDADLVVFNYPGETEFTIIDRLNRAGVATVFYDDGSGSGGTWFGRCQTAARMAVCSSQGQADGIRRKCRTRVITNDSGKPEIAKWLTVIEDLCKEVCSPPKVDIIIPTYNNLKYLKPCVESIRRQTDWPYNLIVVDSGDDETYEWLKSQPDIKVVRSESRMCYSEACNLGIAESKERYVLLLNNDTIVTRYWLTGMMMEAMKPSVGAVGPFSNCDFGFSHNEILTVAGKPLKRMSVMEDVIDIIPEIEKYSHSKDVIERFWIAFYAVLFPREAIEKVGILDDDYKNGHEDFDYCQRLRKAGYRVVNTYDSFVYHFYMRTPRPEPLPKVDEHNQARTLSKYDHPVFVVYTGAAWEPWNGGSLEGEGLGGSETAAVYVARAFAKKGYRAIVFADCKDREGIFDGVEYQDNSRFDKFADSTHMNIFVTSRRPEIFGRPIRADVKLCWCHDTAFYSNDIHLDEIDRYIVVSKAHGDLLHERYKIPEEKLFISRNGVDLDRFSQIIPREKAKLIYTSAPNRGLDILLKQFPKIREEFPEATLHIFYGFNYLEAAAQKGRDAGLVKFIENIRSSFDQPGVIFKGRVPLADLTKEYLSSSLWAYPTYFFENFCISALEAMAAGVPVVTSHFGALPTTVGEAGILLSGDPRSDEYQTRFLEECLGILRDENRWKDYSARGRERAKIFPWSTIADEWLDMIKADQKLKQTVL